MKPKTKKRFTTREQIISRIDKFTIKAHEQYKLAAVLNEDAKELRRLASSTKLETSKRAMLFESKTKQDNADKLFRKCKRLREKQIPLYAAKLAEFDTQVIPGITTDQSVEGI